MTFRGRSLPIYLIGWTAAAIGISIVVLAAADTQVNSDLPADVQNEVRITRNPTDASNLVVAYNDKAGQASSPLGVSFSLNTGTTWADRQLGIPTHPPSSPDVGISQSFIFDPFIDADSSGNIFAGYIATTGAAGGPSGIYIERSTDKGASWSGPQQIDHDVASVYTMAYRFNDRPDMTVGGSDDVYVVWIKDVGVGSPNSDIYFAKSPPAGAPGPMMAAGLDFSGGPPGSIAPKIVNDMPNGTDMANVPDVAVAANGTIYVSWIDVDVTNAMPKPGRLMIDRSLDGGVSFGPDTLVHNISALANHVSTAAGAGTFDDARASSYPAIAVDPANSQTVYMVYAADPQGPDEADIYFTRSIDGGLSWSVPTPINDDGTTTDQIHPMIAVKANGTVDIAWYDKRNAANDDQWDVYFVKSIDGGNTFTLNARITDQSFATPTNQPQTEPWLGEYLGLEVDNSRAYVAFTSSVNDSRGDIFFDTFANDDPLLVKLESLTARSTKQGVLIEWVTEVEIDSVGFRILRAKAAPKEASPRGWQELDLLTSELIPASGTALDGASYRYLDGEPLAHGKTFWYFLEDVDKNGRVTRHGPVAVTVDRPSDAKPGGAAPLEP